MALKCPYKPQILIVVFIRVLQASYKGYVIGFINFAFKRTSINRTNHII